MDVNIIILYMNMNNGIVYIIRLFILGRKILWICNKAFNEQKNNVNSFNIKFIKWKTLYFTFNKNMGSPYVNIITLEYKQNILFNYWSIENK